ncbi:GNAT family N-acetyltransferase [Paenibacillus sp. J2TS4]|uniref:GNAT family N-acetyltransferase n=1 Tax=Paenibacillus sp. J2TS4 TaxID=2807194 RepID=UPI0035B5117B
MIIRALGSGEEPPMELLLLADPSRDIVEGYLGRGQCYVAEEGGSVIGVYVLIPTRPETVELVNVAVEESRHGCGIGKRLVLHAVRTAREQGARTMEVGTGNSSVAQLALYQKCGFRITGVDRDFFTRHYPMEIMENGIPCRDMIRLAQDVHNGEG